MTALRSSVAGALRAVGAWFGLSVSIAPSDAPVDAPVDASGEKLRPARRDSAAGGRVSQPPKRLARPENHPLLLYRTVRRRDRGASLARHVTQAEQRERERIADLLHDDVQQVMAAARLHLSLGSPDPEAMRLLDEALANTRRLSHDLAPRVAGESLADGLDAICRSAAARHRMTVRFLVQPSDSAAPAPVVTEPVVASVTLASVRELLFNASKHAPGAHVQVTLDRGRAWARVRVQDDGPGLRSAPGEALGLRSIQRRLEAVGGHFDAWSDSGGARATLCVPVGD